MLTPDSFIDEFNALTTKRITNRNHPEGYWDFSSIMMYGPTEPGDNLDLLVEPFQADEGDYMTIYRAAKVAQMVDDANTKFIRLWVKDPSSETEAYLAIDMISDYWDDGGCCNKFVNNVNERIRNTQWIRQYQKRSDEIDRWLWTDLYDMGDNRTYNHRNDGDYVDFQK